MRQPPEKSRVFCFCMRLLKPRPCSNLAARASVVEASILSNLWGDAWPVRQGLILKRRPAARINQRLVPPCADAHCAQHWLTLPRQENHPFLLTIFFNACHLSLPLTHSRGPLTTHTSAAAPNTHRQSSDNETPSTAVLSNALLRLALTCTACQFIQLCIPGCIQLKVSLCFRLRLACFLP